LSSSSNSTIQQLARMLGSHLRQGLVTLNVSLGQMPLKAFRALFSARWTKSQISWAIAYAYTIYVALSAIPPFKGTSIFSVTAASGLLVLLYFFHSYANLNLKTASKFFIIAATISFIWEFIGVTTGVPFGQYSYTTSLSPSLLSVPLFIPLLWCALGYFWNTLRPILIHNQSLTITPIRPTLHPTTLVRTRLLLHGSIRLLHHGQRANGLARPILRPSLLDQPSPLDLAVPGRIFRSPAQQLLRLVPSFTNLLRHILSCNQTKNKVFQLRDRLLLPVRPGQCDRRPSLGISLARPSLVHHLHHSNTDHLPSKRRSMEKAARNQRTY